MVNPYFTSKGLPQVGPRKPKENTCLGKGRQREKSRGIWRVTGRKASVQPKREKPFPGAATARGAACAVPITREHI